jgi:methionine sulfoxide reductase heme-binding subunit
MLVSTQNYFQGWKIVGWSGLAIALMVGIILITQGLDEAAVRVAIRATARTSCILFLLAFIAAPLRRFWANKYSLWLVKNRRYLGVSFAFSHALHALTIVSLVIVTSGRTLHDVAYNFGGNLGYIFIIAMTATSFNRSRAWLGERSWHILHGVGIYYLWIAFIVTFSDSLSLSPLYPIFVGLLILAMGLRLVAFIKRRRINYVEK